MAKRFTIEMERTIIDNNNKGRGGYVFSWKSDAEDMCSILNTLMEENNQLKTLILLLGYTIKNDNGEISLEYKERLK